MMNLNAKKNANFKDVLAVLPELKNFAVVHEQKVAWGDMDAFKHLNNVQYHRYIESARITYYSEIALLETGIVTVVFKNSCTYLRSVEYPDTLYIGVRVEELRTSAVRMTYQLYSLAQKALVAEAEAIVVTLNDAMTAKMPIPEILCQKLVNFEALVGNEIKQVK